MSAARVWNASPDGTVRIAIRVQPRARRPSIGGTAHDAKGTARLNVAVAEPPEGGRANDAVLRALARALDLAPSSLQLEAGTTTREKRVRAAADPARLGPLLDRLADGDAA